MYCKQRHTERFWRQQHTLIKSGQSMTTLNRFKKFGKFKIKFNIFILKYFRKLLELLRNFLKFFM